MKISTRCYKFTSRQFTKILKKLPGKDEGIGSVVIEPNLDSKTIKVLFLLNKSFPLRRNLCIKVNMLQEIINSGDIPKSARACCSVDGGVIIICLDTEYEKENPFYIIHEYFHALQFDAHIVMYNNSDVETPAYVFTTAISYKNDNVTKNDLIYYTHPYNKAGKGILKDFEVLKHIRAEFFRILKEA